MHRLIRSNISAVILLLLSSCFFLPAPSLAYVSPGSPTGLVDDFAGVIPAVEQAAIEGELSALQKGTGAQVVVATVPSLGDETVETYAVKLFQEWSIGMKGSDNGVLILIAPADKQARIEVGYGLEGTVTDLQAANVLNKALIPSLKDGDYVSGVSAAVDAISGLIKADPSAQHQYSGSTSSSSSGWGKSTLEFGFFALVIILNVLSRILGRSRSWWLGGVLGALAGTIVGMIWGFVFIGIGAIAALTVIGLIFDYIVSKNPPGSGGGGIWPMFFGGGGPGGFGGGGFGGFGGGSSGGGGASGRW